MGSENLEIRGYFFGLGSFEIFTFWWGFLLFRGFETLGSRRLWVGSIFGVMRFLEFIIF